MYMIFFKGRPAGNVKYPEYEKARQAARKIIRRKAQRSLFDTSNPMLGDYELSVRKVS